MNIFSRIKVLTSCAALLFSLVAVTAQASEFRTPESDIDPEIFRINESEYLGVKIKPDYTFIDHEGKEMKMKDFRGVPLILALSYYTCDGFCPTFNKDLQKVLLEVEKAKTVEVGRDYKIVTLSFDKNDNANTIHHFREMIGLDPAFEKNWTIATFKNPDDIDRFASSIGFKFFWSAPDQMFFHPNAFFFISPEGRVTRILHESLVDAKDMELAILDTRFGTIRPSQILQLAVSICYSYNYKDGKYGLNYPLFFAFGSLFTGVSAFLFAAHKLKKNRVKR